MKQIIVVLFICLIYTSAFGQKFLRTESEIEPKPLTTVESWIQNDPKFEPSWIYEVNFMLNGKLYMLAYEPIFYTGNHVTFYGKRAVFLYEKDLSNKKSPWIAVSDTVFVGNFIDGHNYQDLNFMKKEYASGCVGEYVIEKDCIKITVGYDQLVNGRFSSTPITFVFTPKSNGLFKSNIVPK